MSHNAKFPKPLLFTAGFALTIAGIALVLVWWPDVVVLFKGAAGIVLALAGLLTLYLAGQ